MYVGNHCNNACLRSILIMILDGLLRPPTLRVKGNFFKELRAEFAILQGNHAVSIFMSNVFWSEADQIFPSSELCRLRRVTEGRILPGVL